MKLKDRARDLRKGGNLAEALMWRELKNSQLNGFSFDRQNIIGHFIADFYCAKARTVIEIDGSSHNDKVEYDRQRDAYMHGLGLTVIRISDFDVKHNLDFVLQFLRQHPNFRL